MAKVTKLGRTRETVMSSAWEGERVLDGFASIGRVEAELSKAQDDPKSRPQQFEKARHHFKHQWFIRGVILMRFYFFTFGFSIRSNDGKKNAKVERWEENCRKMYRRYAREAWLEWLIQDNVIGVWRREGMRPPLVFEPERCSLDDTLGNEILKINHGVTQEKVTTIGAFSRAELKEFKKVPGQLVLDHDNKFFGFDIQRRERLGAGFGPPSITPLFVCAGEQTSREVADAGLAAGCRTIMELHLMGHEIKSGIHAGLPTHFWNEKRAKAFEKQTKGKTGHIRASVNFDHVVKQAANWPDPRLLDEKRYNSGITRMAIWSMPIGHMLLAKTINPYLLPMLKSQALTEREYMAEHLYTIFTEALGAPKDIKISWSNKCFAEPRIAADLLKTALAAGPASQTTFLEEAGYDPEEEREYKKMEATLPKSQTTPIYDAAHGPPKKPPGRNPGTKDGQGDD